MTFACCPTPFIFIEYLKKRSIYRATDGGKLRKGIVSLKWY